METDHVMTSNDSADPRSIARKRVRDRSSEPWSIINRKTKVSRPYPSFIDMGTLTLDHPGVRYDEKTMLYDLRDALLAAWVKERSVSVVSRYLGKDFGLKDTEFTRAKWSDCSTNAGYGRVLVDAKTCAKIIRASTQAHARVPLSVEQAALWFEEQAGCSTQPTLLSATVSAHGLANQHVVA